MARSSIAGMSNATLWDKARRFSPDFKQHTSQATDATFTSKGFEALTSSGLTTLNSFTETIMRIAFQLLNASTARNVFADKGLIQVYDTPNGGYVQRMAVNSIKPVSPAYLNLQNGDSVDPWVVRKPETTERFFEQNFEYQSGITIQEVDLKRAFLSEFGIGNWIAGVMQGLENGYTIQEFENIKECMNAALNSTTYPLKDTQVVRIANWSDNATGDNLKAQLTDFILALKNLATAMSIVSQTGMYNALGFETAPKPEDMVLVIRGGIKNLINLNLMVGAFNPDYLSLPFEIVEVDDFGGIEHYADAELTTKVYPIYDSLGAQIGWDTNSSATTPTYTDANVYKKDTNSDVLAILMQRGAIFENTQNPYQVAPIYNPRGLYNNYWASRPHNGIVWDALYNFVAICKPQGGGGGSSIASIGGIGG